MMADHFVYGLVRVWMEFHPLGQFSSSAKLARGRRAS
jgi:hypothetical protein